MPDTFELYKPLRNHLRKVQLIESLGVIRAYMQHFQFKASFPNDIEVPLWFLQARSRVEKKVYEWEVDVLTRELLLHASTLGAPDPRHTLRRWYSAEGVNKLKTLENHVATLYPEGSILLELHRIAHREFPWQRPPNAILLARYYQIFGQPGLDDILRRTIGVGAQTLYLIGLGLAGIYLERFALYYPPSVMVPGITNQDLENFLRHFSLGLEDLRARAAASHEINENYPYVPNPLRIYPIVRLDLGGRPALVAPIPTFLF